MSKTAFSLMQFAALGALLSWHPVLSAAQRGEDIRNPAVAGQFYPADAKQLRKAIQQYLDDAVPGRADQAVALVVPHAGYAYSGQIIADGYSQVRDQRPDTVVILGTNHTTAGFDAISVYPNGAFRTPLGDVPIDQELADAICARAGDCNTNRRVHLQEHSIEVQLPFVQVVFPRSRIVPVVIAAGDPEKCIRFGGTLAGILKGRRTLIVASSDLSHYPSYADAMQADRETLEAIASLDAVKFLAAVRTIMSRQIRNLATCACGEAPILASMAAARSMGAAGARVVSYANSGDALVGDKSRVVGYGAVVMGGPGGSGSVPKGASASSPSLPLESSDKRALLAFARKALEQYLTTQTLPLARGFAARLEAPQGAFVTLKKHGQLRGCIGHLSADTPLSRTVGAMALQAGLNDPRFPPLTTGELREVEIEISVLTPVRPVGHASEIKVGRDGVILQKGERSAVFLPQVAVENGWECPEMLDNLCLKAGLPAGSWKEGARLFVFQAIVFSETDQP